MPLKPTQVCLTKMKITSFAFNILKFGSQRRKYLNLQEASKIHKRSNFTDINLHRSRNQSTIENTISESYFELPNASNRASSQCNAAQFCHQAAHRPSRRVHLNFKIDAYHNAKLVSPFKNFFMKDFEKISKPLFSAHLPKRERPLHWMPSGTFFQLLECLL